MIVFFWFLCAIFSSALASSKNRSGFDWFFVGLLFGPFGLLVAFFPTIDKKQLPTNKKQQPIKFTFAQGARTLENDAYKIYLVKNYKIEFNETLKKHIFNSALYDSVDDALVAARSVDVAKLKQDEEEVKLAKPILDVGVMSQNGGSDINGKYRGYDIPLMPASLVSQWKQAVDSMNPDKASPSTNADVTKTNHGYKKTDKS